MPRPRASSATPGTLQRTRSISTAPSTATTGPTSSRAEAASPAAASACHAEPLTTSRSTASTSSGAASVEVWKSDNTAHWPSGESR